MKKALRNLVAVAVLLIVAVGSFVLGAKGQRLHTEQLNGQIAAGQAMLWFNHLKRYQEIEADLAQGCTAEAHEKVKISIAKEMSLLSSFYRRHRETWVNEYISKRDPELLQELASYKDPYGNSWKEPKCSK